LKYPLFKVQVDSKKAQENLAAVLASGYLNEGEQVIQLEQELSSFLSTKHLTLVNSCTSAITLALRIIGVGVGDEVISTAMTCVATNTPIINSGATLVWADIDLKTGMISVDDVEAKITERTRAIVIVDWAGAPADLKRFDELSQKYDVPVIQDAAHAFGAKYMDFPISDFTDFTCLSFQAIKHFTTGDGGALICRNQEDFALAKKLKWFGYDRDTVKDSKGDWRGQKWDADILPEEVGYKFNMNNVSAAIGLANLPNMPLILEKHRSNARELASRLEGHPKVIILESDIRSLSSNWVFTLRLDVSEKNRDRIIENLNAIGIGAGLVHLPNNRYSAFTNSRQPLKNTDLFASSQLSLPCGWWLDHDDIRIIATKLLFELDLIHD
jgi:perosamine synthetase